MPKKALPPPSYPASAVSSPGTLSEWAPLLFDVREELAAKLRHEGVHRKGSRIAQRADGVSKSKRRKRRNRRGHADQDVEVLWATVALFDFAQDSSLPRRALAARGALPTGLLGI